MDRRYNDAMSAEHLETYLEACPSHLYFTDPENAEFDRYSMRLDDLALLERSPMLGFLSDMSCERQKRGGVISKMDDIVDGLDFDKTNTLIRIRRSALGSRRGRIG